MLDILATMTRSTKAIRGRHIDQTGDGFATRNLDTFD